MTHDVIYRMQQDISKKVDKNLMGYLDPQTIAQTNFNYHMNWQDNAKELVVGNTKE